MDPAQPGMSRSLSSSRVTESGKLTWAGRLSLDRVVRGTGSRPRRGPVYARRRSPRYRPSGPHVRSHRGVVLAHCCHLVSAAYADAELAKHALEARLPEMHRPHPYGGSARCEKVRCRSSNRGRRSRGDGPAADRFEPVPQASVAQRFHDCALNRWTSGSRSRGCATPISAGKADHGFGGASPANPASSLPGLTSHVARSEPHARRGRDLCSAVRQAGELLRAADNAGLRALGSGSRAS